MPNTTLADVIVPGAQFEPYVIQRTIHNSALIRSGIVVHSPEFDALAAGPGRTVNMPFWNNLVAERQVLSDTVPLTVNRINAGQDVAAIQIDGNAWSSNDLVHLLAGADAIAAIGNQLGEFWARMDQALVFSSLKGIFASTGMEDNLVTIASETIAGTDAANRLNGLSFIDATQRLGDRGDTLTTIAMHSVTEATLRKQDLIEVLADSEGKLRIKMFQGRRVVVDDSCPIRDGATDGKVYTTYLFGDGVFARGAAPRDGGPLEGGQGTQGVEIARDALAGDTILINRRRFILHPRGVKFTGQAVATQSPTNDELAQGENWLRVWDQKNVRIVAIEHNN